MRKYFNKSLLLFIIPFVGFLIYTNTLSHEYTLDDIPIIQDNELIKEGQNIPILFKSHYWAGKPNANDKGLYRPLTLTTYLLQFQLTGERPQPFHLVNAILHAITCLLIIVLLKQLFNSDFISFTSAAIFAVHPIHTEAVSGIVGRAELLSLTFILLSVILFRKVNGQSITMKGLLIVGSIISAMCAAFSKELGFLTPVFILLSSAHLIDRKTKLERYVPQLFGLIAMTVCIILIWGIRAGITSETIAHELWAGVSTPDRIATSLRTCLEYAGLMIFPVQLSADYWSTEVPLTTPGNPVVWISVAIAIGITIISIYFRKKAPAFFWGWFFLGISLFPVSNIPFAIGVLKAERILYAPSLGFIVSFAALLYLMYQHKKFKYYILGFILIYITALSIKTWMRNPDWQNNFTLSKATVETSPQSPRMNNILGQALKKQGKTKEATYYLERAVQSRPEHLPAVVNLALMKKSQGDIQGSVKLLEQALRYNPNHYEAGVNLIGIYRSTGQLKKGQQLGERLLKTYPTAAPVMINLGNVYYEMGDMSNAQRLWNLAKGQK